jgi:hypothetical protein
LEEEDQIRGCHNKMRINGILGCSSSNGNKRSRYTHELYRKETAEFYGGLQGREVSRMTSRYLLWIVWIYSYSLKSKTDLDGNMVLSN